MGGLLAALCVLNKMVLSADYADYADYADFFGGVTILFRPFGAFLGREYRSPEAYASGYYSVALSGLEGIMDN